ncbi:TrkH family potassium uptake protein [Dolosigranulum pigrum]|uniref:TrkH family potassium uptake protein n=1 Tax=Dolosigranulum pigrum TaxID=29394 RepID=A0A516GGE6_9LACT|nr:TrkH family potassium uptake protein [Dolosigranulum pigrum]QDO90587.1 TrkH family potassium uptake protein [Dolosigranulum pigrum]RAN58995.1 potassium transporter KefA [Dolosigranulum pigrum]
MNKRIISYTLAKLIQITGVLMGFPVVVSLIYREPFIYTFSFLSVGAVMFIGGTLLSRIKPNNNRLYAKEGFIIVSLSWIIISFFGGLPFVINGDIPSVVDAFFETASGFTTTGASILDDVEALAYSSIFWRSFSHLVGGMGVLVFALAISPRAESEDVHMMRAEMPGPKFDKLVSKIVKSAQILYLIYFAMTIVTIVLLMLTGLPLFDSMIHAFGAAGTGGFGMKNSSFGFYDNVAAEMVLSVAMILFGVNFSLYYFILAKKVKEVFYSEELRWYVGFILGSTLLIATQLVVHETRVGTALRDSFFTVSSIVTTSGFSTANFGQWPLFSQIILLTLMFVGGMAGSTGGGLKVSRIAIMIKSGIREYKKTFHPNRQTSLIFEGESIKDPMLANISNYLALYTIVFVLIMLSVSFEMPDFTSSFSAVAATLNNIGPGLNAVGPSGSFSQFSNFNKLLLTFAMLMGRLEIFPILILFSPKTWRGVP